MQPAEAVHAQHDQKLFMQQMLKEMVSINARLDGMVNSHERSHADLSA
jgi:hypothetical protein